MREFWNQIRLPVLVIGGTLLGVASLCIVAYGVYWATKNPETLGRFVGVGASALLSTFITAVVALLYFVPTAVAAIRRHHNAASIFIVNAFSGVAALLFPAFLAPGIAATIWAGCLAWAVSATPVPVAARRSEKAARGD